MMNNPLDEQIEIEIHPTVLKQYREILQYILEKGHPTIIPNIAPILLSNPFEISRCDDLILMVMDNKQLFEEMDYRRLAIIVMKSYTEYDFDPDVSDYILCTFISVGFKIYEILEKYGFEGYPISKVLDSNNIGRAIVYQLAREYMIEDGFLKERYPHFQIYMYEKSLDGGFMRLHFQLQEPEIPEEKIEELIRLSKEIHTEYDTKPLKAYLDRIID